MNASFEEERWSEASEENRVIRSLLRDLDRHSPGELAHAERVAVYATACGHAMGMHDDELRLLRYAAQLHDIGKARVDAALLIKIGALSTEEIQRLRLHAELALHVISNYDFLRPCLPMIEQHHERWDGSGYPRGLSGEAIHPGARIIAVAEAFDVLVFSPPWKRPCTEEEALQELGRVSGTQIDPVTLEAFQRVQPLIQPLEVASMPPLSGHSP